MNDPKFPHRLLDDDLGVRHSHDLLETAREIPFSPEDQELAVQAEQARRAELAEQARLDTAVAAREEALARRQRAKAWFVAHVAAYAGSNLMLFLVDWLRTGGTWFYWPLLAWSLLIAGHALLLVLREEPVPPLPARSIPPPPKRPPEPPRPLAGSGSKPRA